MRRVLVPAGGLLSCGMQTLSWGMHVGSSSLARDRTRAPCIRSAESYPLGRQGSPFSFLDKPLTDTEYVFPKLSTFPFTLVLLHHQSLPHLTPELHFPLRNSSQELGQHGGHLPLRTPQSQPINELCLPPKQMLPPPPTFFLKISKCALEGLPWWSSG